MIISPAALLQALEAAVGTGEEPDGLCSNRSDHKPHMHDSATLGRFWCTALQSTREPYASQRRWDTA